MRVLFILMVFPMIVVSCGSDNDEDVRATAPVTNEDVREEEEAGPERSVRYSSVTIEENCGFWVDCVFSVRADYDRRPIVLTAHFVDNGSTDTGSCDFQVTLGEGDGDRLESLADRLRICRRANTPTADRGFDGLFLTEFAGKESMVYKVSDGGQEEGGDINYLCGGRTNYYSYLRKLIVPRAPDECPEGYQRLFR